MRLFCFPCRDLKNIPLGIASKMWAVATVSEVAMKARASKAKKYLREGDVGLLYCNPIHSFTTPFVVKSRVDTGRVVRDIWPEAWVLPFDIEPLSNGTRAVSKDLAQQKWTLLNRLPWKGSISATLNFTGTTIFVPTEVKNAEWDEIVSDLT